MRIAITTPTGNVGSATARALIATGAEVVLIARDPSKLQTFQAQGARIAASSSDDRDALARATEGADALLWVTPPNLAAPDLRAWQGRCTDAGTYAVRKNRIPWVVTLSSVGAHQDSGTGPILGVHDAEKAFEAIAPAVLHLRPTFFMENWRMHLGTARDLGQVFVPVRPDAPLPMIAADDIGRYAAQRLREPQQGRHVVGLRGPDDLTWAQAAASLGEALHRPVQLVPVAPEQAYGAMRSMGVGESTTRAYLEMYAGFESGRVVQEPGTPEVVTGTRFADFLRRLVAN